MIRRPVRRYAGALLTGLSIVMTTAPSTASASASGSAFTSGSAEVTGCLAGDIEDLAATPSGNGYWLVGSDGGVFTYGDAGFFGSMGGQAMNRPVVDIVATASGQGYWLIGADGGVFAFGDAAPPAGNSLPTAPLNAPIVAATR